MASDGGRSGSSSAPLSPALLSRIGAPHIAPATAVSSGPLAASSAGSARPSTCSEVSQVKARLSRRSSPFMISAPATRTSTSARRAFLRRAEASLTQRSPIRIAAGRALSASRSSTMSARGVISSGCFPVGRLGEADASRIAAWIASSSAGSSGESLTWSG